MSNPNPNICPICGSPLTQGVTFCKVCGSEIQSKEQPIESEEPSQPQPPPLTFNGTPWFFFILGFVFGAVAMGNSPTIVSSVEWSLGGDSSSIGYTILFGILALISIGLGGFFLWKNRKSKLIVKN